MSNDPTATVSEQEANRIFEAAFYGNEIAPAPNEPVPVQEEQPPAAEPEVTETPVTEPEATKEGEQQPSAAQTAPVTIEQIADSLPEDKRDIFKQLLAERARVEQQHRSAQGRLAAERRQRQQLEQELVKLRSRNSAAASNKQLADEREVVDYENAIGEWKQVKEAEPTLAKAVDALTDAKVRHAVDGIRAEMEGREEVFQRHAFEEEKQREINMLLEIVPNALDVNASPEFRYWKENVAPPGLRHLAETSINHMDAVSVLQAYAPWAMSLANSRNPQPQQSLQTPPPAATNAVADAISNARQEKVSPVVKGAPVRPATAAPLGHEFDADEADRLFKEAWTKIHTNR